MALAKDRIVILKSINFSEADKILTVFGQNRGRFTLLCKGIRKIESKNRGNMQTLSISDITFYEGKNMSILRESSLVNGAEYEKDNYSEIKGLLYLLNKVLVEDQPEPRVFSFLEELFEKGFSTKNVNKFRVRCLQEIGFLPDLKRCSVCGHTNGLDYFETKTFCMICSNCFQKESLRTNKSVVPLRKVKYSNKIMSDAIDNFIKSVIE
ncbi:DNA repair protein RecO [Candidatus Dojkabacteria bacterium]|uniref:DNA repair protein RecO n=1 Tax=Candidatus Dojkabacteria bacterium TaxID=2099670 RepID=A0A955I675_9BACT|nr:DNA repair protein RecO [Candidatus Dojkabacteria bacterium]MCB9790435.1 DNA repair protein RecO [Candidatus Nomurabacteria bacterium]